MNRNDTILLRVSEYEKAGFAEAAELSGLSISSWVRERLRGSAIQELEKAGRKVPFISATPAKIPTTSKRPGLKPF